MNPVQQAINENLIMQIETPMFYNNLELKEKYKDVFSITMGNNLIDELDQMQDKKISLEQMIKQIGNDFYEKRLKYNFDEVSEFHSIFITQKYAVKVQMTAHIQEFDNKKHLTFFLKTPEKKDEQT